MRPFSNDLPDQNRTSIVKTERKEENAANHLRDVASFTVKEESWFDISWEGVAYETEDGDLTYCLYRKVTDDVYIQATVCGFDLESDETLTVLGSVYLTAK